MTRRPPLTETFSASESADGILRTHRTTPGEMLREVAVELIQRSPFQPRHSVADDDAFQALAESIRGQGVIQPILVRELENGIIELMAGERRLSASKYVGRATIPVRMWRGLSDLDAHAIALTENLARADLSAWEEAGGLRSLQALRARQSVASDVRTLAQAIGRSKSHVGDMLLIADRLSPVLTRATASAEADVRLERCTKVALLRVAKIADEPARATALVRLLGNERTPAVLAPFRLRGCPATTLTLHVRVPISAFTPAEAAALWTVLQPLYAALREGVHPRDGPAPEAQGTA